MCINLKGALYKQLYFDFSDSDSLSNKKLYKSTAIKT